jgi:pilus assembly protein Flp/PilA
MYDLVTYTRARISLFSRSVTRSERGASAVEYGLLVSLIAIIIIVAVSLLGQHLSSVFQKSADSIKT